MLFCPKAEDLNRKHAEKVKPGMFGRGGEREQKQAN
jgi:hypothetical protein